MKIFLDNGNSIEKASKFLKHKSSQTTFQHYYKTDAEHLSNGIDFFQGTYHGRGVSSGSNHSTEYRDALRKEQQMRMDTEE